MLRSDPHNYSDAYIVVKGRISVTSTNANRNKKLIFKNNAPFRSCILKINNTFIENAENLNIIMPLCNLLGNNNGTTNKSFEHETKLIGITPQNPSR